VKASLVQKIELATAAAFANFASNTKTARTQTAMTVFGDLGHDLGFMVCCRKCNYGKRDDGEYLYDQFWYADHPTKKGLMARVPMALEAEFSNSEAGIDNDFPKLLQSRADVRVWLWQSLDGRRHIELYKDAIREFGRSMPGYSMPGDEWVFGVYDWLLHKPFIERFTVASSDLLRAGAEVRPYAEMATA
jgi:hypothetical protein